MIKKLLLILISACCCHSAWARQSMVMAVRGVVAVYDIYDNDGTTIWARALLQATAQRAASRFVHGENFDKPLTENVFIDYPKMKYYRSFVIDNDTVTLVNKFRYIGTGKASDPSGSGSGTALENIAGWTSRMVESTRDGDTYQIWYTDNLGFKGTPWPELGVPHGLVTKIVRSGKVIAIATRITQQSTNNELFPPSWGKLISSRKYDRLEKTKRRPYIYKLPVIY